MLYDKEDIKFIVLRLSDNDRSDTVVIDMDDTVEKAAIVIDEDDKASMMIQTWDDNLVYQLYTSPSADLIGFIDSNGIAHVHEPVWQDVPGCPNHNKYEWMEGLDEDVTTFCIEKY
jgi:hypothetical protein